MKIHLKMAMSKMKFKGQTYEEIMKECRDYMEGNQMITLPSGTFCHLCNQELCKHLKHQNKQKLLIVIASLARELEKEREPLNVRSKE